MSYEGEGRPLVHRAPSHSPRRRYQPRRGHRLSRRTECATEIWRTFEAHLPNHDPDTIQHARDVALASRDEMAMTAVRVYRQNPSPWQREVAKTEGTY